MILNYKVHEAVSDKERTSISLVCGKKKKKTTIYFQLFFIFTCSRPFRAKMGTRAFRKKLWVLGFVLVIWRLFMPSMM